MISVSVFLAEGMEFRRVYITVRMGNGICVCFNFLCVGFVELIKYNEENEFMGDKICTNLFTFTRDAVEIIYTEIK